MKYWIAAFAFALVYFGYERFDVTVQADAGAKQEVLDHREAVGNSALQQAFDQRKSNLLVEGSGRVTKLLSDDNKGSRHQRFIVNVNPRQTVLIAHNIDLAPRIEHLAEGDEVSFSGQYEWNSKGGVVHWTHHDPQGHHPGGWLRHQGQIYQ
jgi:hypothetical protein